MKDVGIIGYTGRLGKPLLNILINHPRANITYLANTKGHLGSLDNTDFIFLALPPGESSEYLHLMEDPDRKVIDLSIDNRKNWIYGLPEINKGLYKGCTKMANPGCYATAVLLGLFPIKDFISDVVIRGFSGVSGRTGAEIDFGKGIEQYSEGRSHLRFQK